EGDVRYTASFSYADGGRGKHCDSGYIHWQVHGSTPSPDVLPAPDRYSYAAAPSLAVDPSRARIRFAARVDRVCAESHASRFRGKAYIAAHARELEALA